MHPTRLISAFLNGRNYTSGKVRYVEVLNRRDTTHVTCDRCKCDLLNTELFSYEEIDLCKSCCGKIKNALDYIHGNDDVFAVPLVPVVVPNTPTPTFTIPVKSTLPNFNSIEFPGYSNSIIAHPNPTANQNMTFPITGNVEWSTAFSNGMSPTSTHFHTSAPNPSLFPSSTPVSSFPANNSSPIDLDLPFSVGTNKKSNNSVFFNNTCRFNF